MLRSMRDRDLQRPRRPSLWTSLASARRARAASACVGRHGGAPRLSGAARGVPVGGARAASRACRRRSARSRIRSDCFAARDRSCGPGPLPSCRMTRRHGSRRSGRCSASTPERCTLATACSSAAQAPGCRSDGVAAARGLAARELARRSATRQVFVTGAPRGVAPRPRAPRALPSLDRVQAQQVLDARDHAPRIAVAAQHGGHPRSAQPDAPSRSSRSRGRAVRPRRHRPRRRARAPIPAACAAAGTGPRRWGASRSSARARGALARVRRERVSCASAMARSSSASA